MHLSKEQIVKLVVDAIGPDLCPINELFEKLSNSVEGSFMPFKNFCGFINKRSTLFDFFVVDGTILVRKKVEVKDDSHYPSPSASISNLPMSKHQLEAYVKYAIGSGSRQINQVFDALPQCAKGSIPSSKTLRIYLEKRPHLADLVQKENIVWVKRKSEPNAITNSKGQLSSEQLETHVLEAIGPGSCQITDLLGTVRGHVKGAFGGKVEEFHRFIEKRSHLFELSMDEGGLIFVKKKTNDKDDESSVQSDTSGSLGNIITNFYSLLTLEFIFSLFSFNNRKHQNSG